MYVNNTYDLKNTMCWWGWMATDGHRWMERAKWRKQQWNEIETMSKRSLCWNKMTIALKWNDNYGNVTTTALDVNSAAMAGKDATITVLDANSVAMADDDATTITLDLSFVETVCRKEEWVCNRWKTNLWFLPVLAIMERLSFFLATKYKRKWWLGLVWRWWWWCKRVPK